MRHQAPAGGPGLRAALAATLWLAAAPLAGDDFDPESLRAVALKALKRRGAVP